ncbi:MAG: EVE domain-containing protein [Burkholderiaceae bacterium]
MIKQAKAPADPFARTGYWLMKSEPDECSIDDALAALPGTVCWSGVRNYQARNFIRDAMRIGDALFFYHSSCAEPGIAGLATIASAPYADPTQFDPASPYHDPKSSPDNPRWLAIDVRAERKCRLIDLPTLRAAAPLADMQLLKRGNRLSIMPVGNAHWRYISTRLLELARAAGRWAKRLA